jgi:transcriptional regulator with XRE-family HTH domain
MTQAELARQIGIQQSDLSRMEKGEYRVSLDNLFKLLGVFDLDVADFFGDAQRQPQPMQRPLSHHDMQLLHMIRQLSPETRREVYEYIEFKLRREKSDRHATEVRRNRRTGS